MRPLATFTVIPSLPQSLADLRRLSQNLWWTWSPQAVALFRRMDRELWEKSGHNPVRLLGMLGNELLAELAGSESFLAELRRVVDEFDAYLRRTTWFEQKHPAAGDSLIAYFCFEFGITESLPIYSGGLGVLAGDHLKSASDLGLPLVGVGLLYQEGYFRQQLNVEGWQDEAYLRNDLQEMPVQPLCRPDGAQVRIEINLAGQPVFVRAWQAHVGRVDLVLLDTHLPENPPGVRDITSRLYGGDVEARIRQEIVLGVAGLKALAAIGLKPSVCHINEGHAAFLSLERIRLLMAEVKLSFAEAREVVMASTVFTTHTPVPAGHDRFSKALVGKYFSGYVKELGITLDDLMRMGAEDGASKDGDLVTTALALRLAGHRTAVSRLHARVTRRMWNQLWPGLGVDEVGIGHVANAIHVRSWISRDMAALFDSYLGPRWITEPADQSVWERVNEIPNVELWGTHERRREKLLTFVRRRLREKLVARGAPNAEVAKLDNLLDPETLTIGFARRFAAYKRAGLVISDPERLARILGDPRRPVQIIFAGKAHPRDEEGKHLIRRIVELSREPRFERHIVFLENHDLDDARYLVQGVDLWLNTPRRPMEASGTSGMKAAANGALNVSVLDGWWEEAYKPELGWAIGSGEEYADAKVQDESDAAALYDIIENSIVPLFYDQSEDGVPHRWVEKMKASIGSLAAHYNSSRMVAEYCDRYYVPAGRRKTALLVDGGARAKGLAWWKGHLNHHWPSLRVERVAPELPNELADGSSFELHAYVTTGDILPQDLSVQLLEGRLNSLGEIEAPQIIQMERGRAGEKGVHAFSARVSLHGGGRHGYALRVLPCHADLEDPLSMGLVHWA